MPWSWLHGARPSIRAAAVLSHATAGNQSNACGLWTGVRCLALRGSQVRPVKSILGISPLVQSSPSCVCVQVPELLRALGRHEQLADDVLATLCVAAACTPPLRVATTLMLQLDLRGARGGCAANW